MKRSHKYFLAASFFAFAAPALSSCSLIVGDVQIPGCQSNADCEPINQADHIAADACQRWQCDHRNAANVCRITPRDNDEDGDPDPMCGGHDCDDNDRDVYASAQQGDAGMASAHVEWCDGKDNDCNGYIDETPTNRSVTSQVSFALQPMQQPVTTIQASQVTNGQITASFSAGSPIAAYGAALAGPMAASTQVTTYQLAVGSINGNDSAPTVECPSQMGTTARCAVSEVALDGFDRQLVAAVSPEGCSYGVLYFGYRVNSGSTDYIIMRDPYSLSNVYAGVDTNSSSRCSNGAGFGAFHPSIAAMQPATNMRAQALTTYCKAARADTGPRRAATAIPSRSVTRVAALRRSRCSTTVATSSRTATTWATSRSISYRSSTNRRSRT
jgi:hypothetical protein